VNGNKLTITTSDTNAVPITLGCGYVNQPCVSVTICQPNSGGATSCQTIPNLLLDTGSYGLRIFDNATASGSGSSGGHLNTASLTTTGLPTGLAECVSYADGSYQWGKVLRADIVLGQGVGKVAQNVPIQIVSSNPTVTSPTVPSACVYQQGIAGSADSSSPGLYNGILGVGLFAQDCGTSCNSNAGNNIYFTCSGNNCTGSTATASATVTSDQQVTNPIYFMPTNYNNGVAVQLAVNNIPDSGAPSLNGAAGGYMVMGIGTVSNNTPSSAVKTFKADSYGNFKTQFGGQMYSSSFIDSGSNGLFFPDGCLDIDSSGFFAPSAEVGFSAIQSSSLGTNATTINFNAINADASSNMIFNNLTGDGSGYFDWGLPFFLGRTVYVGIQGNTSSITGATVGPFWAY
jgi:hypothetical protein